MAIWAILSGILKGAAKAAAKGASKAIATAGKGAVTGAKAIGHVGKELGKGAIGMETKASPLGMSGSFGSKGANLVAKAGQYANQLGQAINSQSGLGELQSMLPNQGGGSTPPAAKWSNPFSGAQSGKPSSMTVEMKPGRAGNPMLQSMDVLNRLSQGHASQQQPSSHESLETFTPVQNLSISPEEESALLKFIEEDKNRIGGYPYA